MDIHNQFNNTITRDHAKNSKLSAAYSWPVITIVMILFWPAGIYLMYKRLSLDKTATLKNSKTVAVIAYILIAMCLIYLIGISTGDMEVTNGESTVGPTIVALLLFGGGGFYLLTVSKRMKRNGVKYKQYIALIVNENLSSIDNIAASVGVSYDEAKKDLQKMIDCGYFTGAYIHTGNREIILPNYNIYAQPAATAMQTETTVVTCKSCGANNKITIGKTHECEYCGSPIQ